MLKKISLALAAATLATLTVAPAAQAAVVASTTHARAEAAAPLDTFHDAKTDFVYVRLAGGWRFVGRDVDTARHAVFHDAPTGFVFVRLNHAWRFVGRFEAPTALASQAALATSAQQVARAD